MTSPAVLLWALLALAITLVRAQDDLRSLNALGVDGLYGGPSAGFIPGGLRSSYGLLGGSIASLLLGGGGFYPSKSYIPAGTVGSSSSYLQQMSGYGYRGGYNPGSGYGGPFDAAGSGGYLYGGAASGGYPYGATASGGYPYGATGSGSFGGGFAAPGVPVIPELKVSLTGPGGFPMKGSQVGALAQYGYPGSQYAGALYSQQVSTEGYPGAYPTVIQAAGGQHLYPGGYLGVQAQQQYTPGIGAVSSVLSKQATAFAPYGPGR